MLLLTACTMATPRDGPDDIIGPDGDGDSDVDGDVDGDADGDGDGDIPHECMIDGVVGEDPRELVIQLRNPDCDTTICMFYNLHGFCTHRCDTDEDCRDIGNGRCEIEIFVGDREFFGWYCVPRYASNE